MSAIRMDEVKRQRFADAVEASVQVHSRQQFFVWTQSAVQGLVPHQILICGLREHSNPSLTMHHFSSSRYFRQAQFQAVADPVRGLLPMLSATSRGSDTRVVLVPSSNLQAEHRALFNLVNDNELQNLAALLLPGADGEIGALFAFSRVDHDLDASLCHAVELLIPHLHHTFIRVLHNERDQLQASMPREVRVVTPRQQEILMLIKEGKTNTEIADVLDCSQWTVKNHIQNILRRLGTSSRAHAISRAMSLGILRPD